MLVIYMLCLRQLKRFIRVRARIVGALGQPLTFLLVLGFGFGPIYAKATGGNYLQLLVPGIVLMGVLYNAVFSGMDIIWDRQFGFLKATLVAPVSRFQLVLGRILGGSIVAFSQGILVFIVCFIVGYRIENVELFPFALLIMFWFAVFATGIGTIIGSILKDMQAFPIIMNLLIMPLLGFSGAFFPIYGLSKAMRIVVYSDPLSYGVDSFRTLLGQQSHFGLQVNFAIWGLITVVVLFFASYLFSKIQIE